MNIKGWFALNDDFSVGQRPGRSFVGIYLSTGSTINPTPTAYAIHWYDADYAKNTWVWRDMTISGLTPSTDYWILIGRCDSWSTDWRLVAKWEGVSASSNLQSTFRDYTVNLNNNNPVSEFSSLYRIIDDNGPDSFIVDTYGWSGAPAFSYGFMGLTTKTYTVKADGTLRIQGSFRLHDTFPSYEKPGRSYMSVYVINSAGQLIKTQYLVKWDDADYRLDQWIYRDITISGLTASQIVNIGIGRMDAWTTDYELTAEWMGVVITGA
jgi:hypothetical protein